MLLGRPAEAVAALERAAAAAAATAAAATAGGQPSDLLAEIKSELADARIALSRCGKYQREEEGILLELCRRHIRCDFFLPQLSPRCCRVREKERTTTAEAATTAAAAWRSAVESGTDPAHRSGSGGAGKTIARLQGPGPVERMQSKLFANANADCFRSFFKARFFFRKCVTAAPDSNIPLAFRAFLQCATER